MAQYSEEWFYPTGQLAANQRAIVFGPGDDNTIASIFSDPGLTTPLANPTVTDANGVLEFYAADGTYWIWVGPTTGGDGVEVTLGASPSAGDVTGPASSTDNAVVRFDGVTGKLIQNSTVTLSDGGTLTFPGQAGPLVAHAPGQLFYNTTERCLSFDNTEPDVRIDIGQELWLEVRNVTGSTIANGAAVYITGTHASGLPTIALAQANSETTALVIGLATHSIENNTNGFVAIHGIVRDVNAIALGAGSALYLSATTPGGLTTTPPVAPNYRVRLGIVSKGSAGNGAIAVNIRGRDLGLGTANQIYGVNAGATGPEYKTIQGTANRLTVTHGVGTITLDVDSQATRRTLEFVDDRNVLTTGSGDARWYNREGSTLTIIGAWASAGIVPTDAAILVDANINGTTIYTTQANRPTVPAGGNGGALSVTPDVTSLAQGDYLTVDIDQVGSTIPGGRLTVGVVVQRAG